MVDGVGAEGGGRRRALGLAVVGRDWRWWSRRGRLDVAGRGEEVRMI